MAEKLDIKDLVTMDELTLSNAWQLDALVEVLVVKGMLTKREIFDELTELRRRAAAPQNELSVDAHKTDVLITHILEIFNSSGMTAQQAKDVLAHLQILVEIGERVAHGKKVH
jgi:hypothetical protein